MLSSSSLQEEKCGERGGNPRYSRLSSSVQGGLGLCHQVAQEVAEGRLQGWEHQRQVALLLLQDFQSLSQHLSWKSMAVREGKRTVTLRIKREPTSPLPGPAHLHQNNATQNGHFLSQHLSSEQST